MTFTVELLFTGLALFCFTDTCTVQNHNLTEDWLFLPNATTAAHVCENEDILHGGHDVFLQIEADDFVEFDAILDFSIDSSGETLLRLPLDQIRNNSLCFADASGNPLIGKTGHLTPRHPNDLASPFLRHGFSWISSLSEIAGLPTPLTLRQEIFGTNGAASSEPQFPNEIVSAAIRLPPVELMSREILVVQAPANRGTPITWKWRGVSQRALTGRIDAQFNHTGLLKFGLCNSTGKFVRSLLGMMPFDGNLKISISNGPKDPGMAQRIDFLWYLRLLPEITTAMCESPTDMTTTGPPPLAANTGCIPTR